MNQEISLYRENEKRINRISLYLLAGIALVGVIMILIIRTFTPVKAFFSYWYALYILCGGAILVSVPAFLIRFRPDSRVTKYFLVGGNVALAIFANILLARISENNFMNYFWAIVFSSLYFNKKTTIFASVSSFLSYLLLVIFIPEIRPHGFQSFQASLIIRLFYLSFVGVGCTILTILANNLFQRILGQEKANDEALQEINVLLKDIAVGGNTLTASTGELQTYIAETGASMEQTQGIVQNISFDAAKTREGMDRARNLLNSLVESTGEHQELTGRTVQLTENIIKTAAKGSDDVFAIEQEINNVSLQFGSTLDTIDALNKDSQKIGEIVQTVSNIAEQTKMLSMNAAIEAARAGEYGRGFAVVASKINKLSIQTQDTLKQIETIIKKFLPQLALTVSRTQQTAEVLEKGVQNVGQINESFSRIINTLQEGLPLLQEVGDFIKNQAGIAKEIDIEVTNAHDFSLSSETGMKELTGIFTKFTDMARILSASTQQLNSLAETLTAQARTRFSDAELQLVSEAAAVKETSKSEADDLEELIKSIDFDDLDTGEFDLEAFERSLSEIET